MTRKLLVGAIVAGALTVTAGTAFALSQGSQPTSGAAPTTTSAPTSLTTSASTTTSTAASGAPAELTADDAARIAQTRVDGTVHEIEREDEHGRLEWKVEIRARDGVTHDVRVDAVTGDITRVEADDRDDHDDDKADDDHDDDRDDD